MKKAFSNPWFYFRLTLVAGMVLLVAFFYQQLPNPLPIHWNFEGEVENWGEKRFYAWLMPAIALGMTLLFPLLAQIDPRKRNYDDFAPVWERIQTAFILFFTYMQGVILYITLNPDKDHSMDFWLQLGVGILFVLMGNWVGKFRSNYLVGVRTPWTLEDPEVWQKSQRVGGWMFVGGGIVFIIQAWLQWNVAWVFRGVIGLMVLVPVVASFIFSKRKKR